jgi:hypothetical protein
VELYALASRHAYVADSVWFQRVAGDAIIAAHGALPEAVVAAAQQRGLEGDLLQTTAELLKKGLKSG